MSDRNTSTFYISNERSRENVRKFVEALPLVDEETKKPVAWRFIFKKVGQERTNRQNNYLFGVVYPPIMSFMGLHGDRDRKELHTFWLIEYFGAVEKKFLHRKKVYPKRTTTTSEDGARDPLKKKEFAEFVDFIIIKAAEHGIYVPPPDADLSPDGD